MVGDPTRRHHRRRQHGHRRHVRGGTQPHPGSDTDTDTDTDTGSLPDAHSGLADRQPGGGQPDLHGLSVAGAPVRCMERKCS
jgi:hypothetical protein